MSTLSQRRIWESRELGVLIGLASMAMLFGALFLVFKLFKIKSPTWPPIGVEAVPPMWPMVATAFLLCSSICFFFALKRPRLEMKTWWSGVCFGVLFLVAQFFSFGQIFARGSTEIQTNFLSMLFVTYSGLHALHVVFALAALIWLGIRFAKNASETNFEWARLATWVWHAVDVVWIFIFFLVVDI